MTKAILALHNMPPYGLAVLEDEFDVIKLWKENNPDQIIHDRQNDIVGIVSSYNRGVSGKLIEALPNLEIISTFGVGTDNIDLQKAHARGIVVTNTPDLLTSDTADTALALLLSVSRRVVEGDAFVRVGKWRNGPLPLGTSLSGKTAGIVGLGRIGQAIARRLAAFDMSIVYHGRSEKDVPYKFYADLQSMAQDVDFLVLSCAGGPETQHIINLDVLKALGAHGFLVNVARGSVVDEQELLIALQNKDIAGAGLDVYENEPHVPEALFSMDNVVLLPHIGSATAETRREMGALVVENIQAHFRGEPLKTPVTA